MLFVNEKYNPIQNILNNINEATMKGGGANSDYTKYGFKYALAVIDKLLNGEEVRLGGKGDAGSVSGASMNAATKRALIDLKDNIANSTVDDFNDAVKDLGIKWTNIFKGDVTGYSDGLASKNKGNAFEAYFIDNFSKFEPEIKKLVKYKKLIGISADGGLNQKRPLTFSGDKITCGPAGDYDIGHTVTDITLTVDKGKKIYLSLKSGNTVTFVNAGIKKLFTNEFFAGEKLTGDGKTLLKMFNIDEDKFRAVFANYQGKGDGKKTKSEKEVVDITSKLNNNKIFDEFVRSVIGYGFIMVHQISGDNVEFISFLTEDDLNKFVSNIESAKILYPIGGKDKRVDIVVRYPSIEIKFNIRSKDGGVLPTHIMADYKFIK